jgi:hypothetical protein
VVDADQCNRGGFVVQGIGQRRRSGNGINNRLNVRIGRAASFDNESVQQGIQLVVGCDGVSHK